MSPYIAIKTSNFKWHFHDCPKRLMYSGPFIFVALTECRIIVCDNSLFNHWPTAGIFLPSVIIHRFQLFKSDAIGIPTESGDRYRVPLTKHYSLFGDIFVWLFFDFQFPSLVGGAHSVASLNSIPERWLRGVEQPDGCCSSATRATGWRRSLPFSGSK